MSRLISIAIVASWMLLTLAGAAPADDWTLQFEDGFEREDLGDDWWSSGLTRIEDGRLVVGREGEMGRNIVMTTRQFEGAIRLEYDAMAPVDNPGDLSAIINGSTEGESSGFFFGFGSQLNTTGRFLLRGQAIDEYEAIITPGEWHHVVAERFENRFRHIIDGEVVFEYTHEDPLPGPLNRHVGFYVWHKGIFDNVKVFTRPEDVEVVETIAGKIPRDELEVAPRVYPAPGKIGVSITLPQVEGERYLDVSASLLSLEHPERLQRINRVTAPGMREEIIFDAQDLPAGPYVTHVQVSSRESGDTEQFAQEIEWPGRDPRFADVKVLNNLVWELLKVDAADGGLNGAHFFDVPIERWLYIRSKAEVGDGSVSLSLDSDDPSAAFTVHDGSEPVMVAKRRVPAGQHTIHVTTEGEARLLSLEVRAIPDIQHSRYPTQQWLKSNPAYDWEFVTEHVMPAATTIITSGDPEGIREQVEEWIDRGGRWIVYTSRPGLHGNREIEQSGEGLFEYFSSKPGFAHPLMDGVLVDEFYTLDDPAYPAYIEMARMLADEYPEKGFFPYVAGRFGMDEGSVEFARQCFEADGMICREAYLAEWPTLLEALTYMRQAPERMIHPIEDALAGAIFNTVWVPGTFSFPWPFADGYPSVNYNAYLDMQMQMVATHPAFFGLGGLHIWRTGYTDEERVRWMWRLFEHYAIEGNTARLSTDPYLLRHIDNPDFVDGLDGWTARPAAEDGLEPVEIEGYGKLQGRYYRGNDTALLMRRSADGPNTITQTIRGLRVGQYYSVKMLSADHGELQAGKSQKTLHPLSVTLSDCEPVEGGKYDYQEAYNTRQRVGAFTRENPLWINYHWHVFRATGTTATLTISDWVSPDDPGGPVGQELLVNFIEVKPFLMD